MSGRRRVEVATEYTVRSYRSEIGLSVAVEVRGGKRFGRRGRRKKAPTAGVVGIDECDRRRSVSRADLPVPARLLRRVDQLGGVGQKVDPAVAVQVLGGEARGVGRQRGQRCRLVFSAQPVPIDHSGMIGVGDGEIHPLRVRYDVKRRGGKRLARDERKVRGPIRPSLGSTRPGIAHVGRALAQQDQIEVVVVIDVEEDRRPKIAGR